MSMGSDFASGRRLGLETSSSSNSSSSSNIDPTALYRTLVANKPKKMTGMNTLSGGMSAKQIADEAAKVANLRRSEELKIEAAEIANAEAKMNTKRLNNKMSMEEDLQDFNIARKKEQDSLAVTKGLETRADKYTKLATAESNKAKTTQQTQLYNDALRGVAIGDANSVLKYFEQGGNSDMRLEYIWFGTDNTVHAKANGAKADMVFPTGQDFINKVLAPAEALERSNKERKLSSDEMLNASIAIKNATPGETKGLETDTGKAERKQKIITLYYNLKDNNSKALRNDDGTQMSQAEFMATFTGEIVPKKVEEPPSESLENPSNKPTGVQTDITRNENGKWTAKKDTETGEIIISKTDNDGTVTEKQYQGPNKDIENKTSPEETVETPENESDFDYVIETADRGNDRNIIKRVGQDQPQIDIVSKIKEHVSKTNDSYKERRNALIQAQGNEKIYVKVIDGKVHEYIKENGKFVSLDNGDEDYDESKDPTKTNIDNKGIQPQPGSAFKSIDSQRTR